MGPGRALDSASLANPQSGRYLVCERLQIELGLVVGETEVQTGYGDPVIAHRPDVGTLSRIAALRPILFDPIEWAGPHADVGRMSAK